MRRYSTVFAVVLLIGAAAFGATAPSAQANDFVAYEINGTYAATSDGTFATTNYAFHDEETVRSTWTITSTCVTDVKCTGQVTSDQGWSAPLYTEGHVWYVQRDIPNWGTCPEGTLFGGHQTFQFYPSDANGVTKIGSPYLEGKDKTNGDRFACAPVATGQLAEWRTKPLTIVLPFRLDKLG